MLKKRNITALIKPKYTSIMNAVEISTNKHMPPLTNLNGVIARCFMLLFGLQSKRFLAAAMIYQVVTLPFDPTNIRGSNQGSATKKKT